MIFSLPAGPKRLQVTRVRGRRGRCSQCQSWGRKWADWRQRTQSCWTRWWSWLCWWTRGSRSEEHWESCVPSLQSVSVARCYWYSLHWHWLLHHHHHHHCCHYRCRSRCRSRSHCLPLCWTAVESGCRSFLPRDRGLSFHSDDGDGASEKQTPTISRSIRWRKNFLNSNDNGRNNPLRTVFNQQ